MENKNEIVQSILSKEVFNVDDIATLFDLKKCKAYKMLRQIKCYSDVLGIAEKCHKKDYYSYINRFDNK